MLALVTGAGGFLGRYIAEMLVARGDRVRSLSRSRYSFLDDLGVQQFEADLLDEATLKKAATEVDVVFHTAAIAGIGGRRADFVNTNVRGTLNVIAACRAAQVPKLVYTSSPSVTFAGRDQCGIDESAPYPERFLADYPATKAEAERHVLSEQGQHGVYACALRPHLIWGPRDQHLIPRLLERARRGQLRRVGEGKNLVDTVYVENAAEAHLQAADALIAGSPVCGQAYFISQGQPVNCWDWINEILALADLPPVTKSIPYRNAYAAGALLETVYRFLGRTDEPLMTRFLAAQLATSHWFDITRAQNDFGYQPRVSMEEGLRRLGQWLRVPK